MKLTASLLGRVSLRWADEALQVRSKKALALLVYLTRQSGGASREALALLLWGPGKLNSVRQALYELRKLPGAERWLFDDPERVRVGAETDVARLEAALADGRVADAVTLYGGPFLGELTVENAPNFDEWAHAERERLANAFVGAQFTRLETLENAQKFEDALTLAGNILDQDNLNESAHRAVMRLLHRAGRPEAAVEQFERLREALRDELGVEPLPETLALLGDVENARGGGVRRALLLTGSNAAVPGGAEHFVGREGDLARAAGVLEAGSLLVHGFGGVGKTAFAAELARVYLPGGVLWLDVGADGFEDAANALAAALGQGKKARRRRGQNGHTQNRFARGPRRPARPRRREELLHARQTARRAAHGSKAPRHESQPLRPHAPARAG